MIVTLRLRPRVAGRVVHGLYSKITPEIVELRMQFDDLTKAFVEALGTLPLMPALGTLIGVGLHLFAKGLQEAGSPVEGGPPARTAGHGGDGRGGRQRERVVIGIA